MNPYKTREGGATVTVFVPYDCENKCPFCVNKAEYADTSLFRPERIFEGIQLMDVLNPRCDFVFSGGEPLSDLSSLQTMLDLVPPGHRVFINTTLPVMRNHTEAEILAFFEKNRKKINCVNVSRHLHKYVVEGDDGIFGRLPVPARINCVLFGAHPPEKILGFVERFAAWGVPIQFRSDYTKTTPENLYDEAGDEILKDLRSILAPTMLEGCRIRCNYEFDHAGQTVSYHKTLPYSTITETDGEGRTWDILYDVLIKQNGDFHSDWDGTPLNLDAYRDVIYEPYDLHRIF